MSLETIPGSFVITINTYRRIKQNNIYYGDYR